MNRMDTALKKLDVLDKAILEDFDKAWEAFKLFEMFYQGLSDEAKAYLKEQSDQYKKILKDIQNLILPAVRNICPQCNPTCCKLSFPEKSIYIASSVGCFKYVDYLLVRCDTDLPAPDYANAEKNLCPFWDNGCRLPADCRSFMCIEFFCDRLKQEINEPLVKQHVKKAKQLIENFATEKCMV